MGVQRIRSDSVKELRKQKTRAELQKENEQLQAKGRKPGGSADRHADGPL